MPNVSHRLPFLIEQFRREATKRMRLRPAKCEFRTGTGTSIALAVLLCAWPSNADAGCSHNVVAKNDSGQIAHRLDIIELEGRVNDSSEVPAQPKPCSGALCSGNPAVPVPVTVSIAVFRPLEAVVPRPPASTASTAGQLFAYAERNVRAVIEGPSIERPPR